MKIEELDRYLEGTETSLNVLLGRQAMNTLVLQLLLLHSPHALASLQSLDLSQVEGLLLSRNMSDQSIQHALSQLALLRDPLGALS